MAETQAAQKQPQTPFFGMAGFSGQFFVKSAEAQGRVKKEELVVSLGGRYQSKRSSVSSQSAETAIPQMRVQFEPRFFNFNLEFPEVFGKPRSFAFTTGLWLRLLSREERVGLVSWAQVGAIRRNFTVEKMISPPGEEVNSDASLPSLDECEAIVADSSLGGNCEDAQQKTYKTQVTQYQTGLDLITGLNAGLRIFQGRPHHFNLEARFRLQTIPREDISKRRMLRFFGGFSTGIHPKVERFINTGFMLGPEFNLENSKIDWLFHLYLQLSFDVSPRGFQR